MSESVKLEEQLFTSALALPVAERDSYLDRACGDNRELRSRVEALLEAFSAASHFMEDRPWAAALGLSRSESMRIDESAGDQIGDYRLLQEIGEGGCGVVYLAEQSAPVRRQVALKIIKLGMDTKAVIARFEAERQTLAMMDHPNIAKVFDAGATPAGRPYFVMELVRGIKITDYCDEAHLSTAERLMLFVQVCHAIQHAHLKGIIHRDIKPSNVLVTLHDGVPVAKVIDFGIAKATQGRLTDETLYTALEQFIGTPAYVSPEQTEPGRAEIDTRSDIYSLGVLLYELLTGCTPFDTAELLRAGFDEMRQRIRKEEPPTPSRRLRTLTQEMMTSTAAHRQTASAKLIKMVHGDLDWIVMQCLEKEPARRYPTANDLAKDLQRYLSSEPVKARPPSLIYIFRKFARRHQTVFATGAAIVVVLMIATAVSTWQAVRATRAENLAQIEAATSREVISFLQDDLLAQASPTNEPDRELKLRTVLDRAAEKISERFTDQPMVEVAIRETLGKTYDSLGEYATAQQHFERALQICQQRLGSENRQTLRMMGHVAGELLIQGKYAEAERMGSTALQRLKRITSIEDPLTLGAMSNLALVYHYQGKFAQAEELLVDALEVTRRTVGPEDRETLTMMNNLALAYRNQGKLAEAEAMHSQELEISRRVMGPEHPETLTSMSNLSKVYADQGKFAQAIALEEQALKISARVLGEEHPETVISAHNLGTAYADAGRYAEAEALQLETTQIAARSMGPEHPDTLKTLSTLALVYQLTGRLAEAENVLAKIIDTATRVLGPEDPVTVRVEGSMALVLQDQHRLTEAESLMSATLEKCRRVFGPDHPYTLNFTDGLAGIQLESKKFAAAEQLLRESLQTREKQVQDWRASSARSQLGAALLGLNRFAEAEPLLIESHRDIHGRAATIPARNKSVLEASGRRVVELYRAWGKQTLAQQWEEKLKSDTSDGVAGEARKFFLRHSRAAGNPSDS